MTTELFKVVFHGEIDDAQDSNTVKHQLASLLDVPESRADQLFSGKALELKKNVDYNTALKYKTAVEKTGARCNIEPMDAASPPPLAKSTPAGREPPPSLAKPAPKPPKPELSPAASPSPSIQTPPPPPREQQNYYAAPSAPLISEPEESGEFELQDPRKVSAGHGWLWIKTGFGLFKQSPGKWIVMVLIWIVLISIMSVIPFLSIAVYIIGPIFTAGFMVACYSQDQGYELEIGQLFAGFKQHAGRLAGIGALNLVAIIGIGLVAALLLFVFGGGVAALANLGAMGGGQFGSGQDINPMVLGLPLMLMILCIIALTVPVVMAFWFAPVLAMLHDVPALQSIGLSLKGCLINWLPFLIYGLILFGLMIVAAVPLLLGFIVLGPILVASIYTSHKDIFVHDLDV